MNENEFEIKTEVLKKAQSLNKETYVLFCALTRYKDKLTEPAFRFMADKLFLLYREEFERMTEQYLIERAQKKYEFKKRRLKFVPRETWFLHRKNLAAKYFIDGVTEEADGFFAAFKKKLAERKRRKHEKHTPATLPPTGVNVLSEQAAPRESLPITTLQACDELVNYARMEEGLPPPKSLKEWYRKYWELHPAPATVAVQWPPEIAEEVRKAAREVFTEKQVAEIAKVNSAYAALLEVTKSVAHNEPPTPQNPPKQGTKKDDRVSHEAHETPKTGNEVQ